MALEGQIVTGVDFVAVPTSDLDAAVDFYGTKLGLTRSIYRPANHFAEFETGSVTLSVIVSEKFGLGFHPNQNAVALHVEDVERARAELTARGIEFAGDTLDTGVCHMAFFSDPDGNALMLHNRYAPRVTES
jgi:predicted enzyme related to lactoylglutathione lyase